MRIVRQRIAFLIDASLVSLLLISTRTLWANSCHFLCTFAFDAGDSGFLVSFFVL